MKTFTNPVLTGFNPDPSIARCGDDFFLITSSFEYFPGIPIYHSRDLVNWTHIGHALTRPSQLQLRTVEPSAGIWASTIRYYDGRFFIATAKWDRYRPQTDVCVSCHVKNEVTDSIIRSEYFLEDSMSAPKIYGTISRGRILYILIIQASIKTYVGYPRFEFD